MIAARGDNAAARFAAVSLGCPDPEALGDFYLRLLGGERLWRSARSVGIQVPGVVLVMQRVQDYRPPVWPGSAIVHLDMTADGDIAAAAARAVEAGAVLADFQPDPRWSVLLDPAGHPFCITSVAPARRPPG
jgi:catechol 2,3-dioxygenase-like lactoylglutathione lyase family enzyme